MTKSFKDIANSLGDLVTEKNAAYGDATKTGAEAMRRLFPNGVKPEQYEDFGYCLLVWHKLSRVATNPNAFGENPKQDIAGYSILALSRDQDSEAAEEPNPAFVCPRCVGSMENKVVGGLWIKHICWSCWHKQYRDLDGKALSSWRESANEREIREVEGLLSPPKVPPIEVKSKGLFWPSETTLKICKVCYGYKGTHTCIYGSPA